MGNDLARENLYRQISKGDTKTVSAILNKYPSLLNEQLNEDQMCTPLILSIKKYNRQIVDLLLKRGANYNMCNRKGITPLMVCAMRDNVMAYVQIFSEFHPDVEAESKEGMNALDYAVVNGHYEFSRKLYNTGKLELKTPEFYREIQKKYNLRYVNYDVFIMHLTKDLTLEALPEVYQPVKPKIKDPVIDPRQSWKDFFVRVGNFDNPPMVSRNSLPDELKPQNRSFLSRLRTRIQLGKSQVPKKYCQSALNLDTAGGTQAQIGRERFASEIVHVS